MDNLRIILLIIGCLIIFGIYFWEVFRKPETKRKETMLDAVDEIPDMPVYGLSPTTNNDTEAAARLADVANLITRSRDELKEPIAPIEPKQTMDFSSSMSVKDYEASVEDKDEFDVFAAVQDDLQQHETSSVDILTHDVSSDSGSENEGREVPAAEIDDQDYSDTETHNNVLGNVSDDLIVLYITSPAQTLFNGLSLSKAADEVGMVYGHMNVFHHFGPGKLHSGQPLFSLANMYEPGSFDLGRMADLRTKGIVLFMYSPASIEASVVFELFLNTAQRIAELLGGEIRNQHNQLVNHSYIKQLRDKAEQLSSI